MDKFWHTSSSRSKDKLRLALLLLGKFSINVPTYTSGNICLTRLAILASFSNLILYYLFTLYNIFFEITSGYFDTYTFKQQLIVLNFVDRETKTKLLAEVSKQRQLELLEAVTAPFEKKDEETAST